METLNGYNYRRQEEGTSHTSPIMSDIASLKDELKVFIESVSLVENENEELRKKVSLLEQENDQWQDAYDHAKENWRNQGIQHGLNVRKQVNLENAGSFQAFQAEMTRRSTQVSQHKPDGMLASLLIRSRLDLAIAEHQQRVLVASGPTLNLPFAVEDFDIEDNHVGIVNRTTSVIKLMGYTLMFRESGAIFKFPDTDIDPHSSISVWYGAAHNTMRNSSSLGSLLWCPRNNNQVMINDAEEIVDLVDPQGIVVASVSANKPRQHVSERLSLFCANTQGGIKRPADTDEGSTTGDYEAAASNNQMVLSVRKPKKSRYVDEHYHNNASMNTMALTPCTPGTLLARLSVGSRGGRGNQRGSHPQTIGDEDRGNDENMNGYHHENDDSEDPSQATGYTSVSALSTIQQCAPLSCRTPTTGPNHAPNLAAFRPTLFGKRQSGAMSFAHAHRSSQEEFVAIRLTCCAMNGQGQGLGHSSRGKGLVDLSGWRLIAMGNPTMEFVLYDRAVMPASGRLTLISGTDPRSMATMHALHAHWRRLDGGDEEEEDDDEDEDEEGSDDRSSEYSGGGVLTLTPRTTTSSSSNMNRPQNQHHQSTENHSVGFQATAAASASHHRLRSTEVCEVAGLSALATGDVAAFFLIDLNGHTVCMMQCSDNEDECMDPDNTTGSNSLQVRTVFGDYYPEKKKTQRTMIPTILTTVSKSMSCVVQ